MQEKLEEINHALVVAVRNTSIVMAGKVCRDSFTFKQKVQTLEVLSIKIWVNKENVRLEGELPHVNVATQHSCMPILPH